MATDGSDRLDDAFSRLSGNSDLGDLMVALLAGTFMTLAYQFWAFIESLGGAIMKPFRAFASALASLVTGSIGGPVVLLEASVQTGVESVTEGLFSTFGIFAYPVTMVAVMLGIYIFSVAWRKIDLSPWNFLRNMR